MKQTLVALVENKPGVLNRVASLFRRRNFNIDSLTVGRTENPDISRMTIVVDGEGEKVANQLHKLVNVIQVEEVTKVPSVNRDLALIKVAVDSETRYQVVQLCEIFRARIVDTSPETVVVEVTGDEEKISSLVTMLERLGFLEVVGTGGVTRARGTHVLSPNGYVPRPLAGNGTRASIV